MRHEFNLLGNQSFLHGVKPEATSPLHVHALHVGKRACCCSTCFLPYHSRKNNSVQPKASSPLHGHAFYGRTLVVPRHGRQHIEQGQPVNIRMNRVPGCSYTTSCRQSHPVSYGEEGQPQNDGEQHQNNVRQLAGSWAVNSTILVEDPLLLLEDFMQNLVQKNKRNAERG